MAKNVSKFVETASAPWKNKMPGIDILPLNPDKDEKGGSYIVRMAAGSTFPRHRHPDGEEIFVLKGRLSIGNYSLKAGDFLFSPPGTVHAASTIEGCVYFVLWPKPVAMMSDTQTEAMESVDALESIEFGQDQPNVEIPYSEVPEPTS